MSSMYSFHIPHLCLMFSHFCSLYISRCTFGFTFYFSNSFFSIVKIAIYLTNLIILSMKKIFFTFKPDFSHVCLFSFQDIVALILFTSCII